MSIKKEQNFSVDQIRDGWMDPEGATALNATYISTTSFTVDGDLTDVFVAGRNLRIDFTTTGILYCTVVTSSYSAGSGLTTITVQGQDLVNEAIDELLVSASQPGGLSYLGHVLKTTSFATTSASWVDVTDLTKTVTVPAGKRVLLMVSSDIFNDTAGGRSGFSFDIDGTTVNSAGWGLIAQDAISAQDVVPFCMTYITSVLSAGSHTFKVRMKVQTGTTGALGGTAAQSVFSVILI